AQKLDGVGQAGRTGNTAVQQTGQIALAHRGVLNITQVFNKGTLAPGQNPLSANARPLPRWTEQHRQSRKNLLSSPGSTNRLAPGEATRPAPGMHRCPAIERAPPATGPSRATKQGALRPAQAAQRVLRRFPCVGLQLAIERRTGQIIGKVADRRQADAGNHFQSLLVAVTGGTEISQGLVGYLTTGINHGATEQSQCLQALVVDLIKATRTQG